MFSFTDGQGNEISILSDGDVFRNGRYDGWVSDRRINQLYSLYKQEEAGLYRDYEAYAMALTLINEEDE